MHPEDAKELAGNTKTVGYHEWVDIPNGLMYQSCCDCGLSHSIMVALPDPDAVPEETLRVRFLPEPTLTDATREQERLSIPYYREVIRLREENINLKRMLRVMQFEVQHDKHRYAIQKLLGDDDGNRSTNDATAEGNSCTDSAGAAGQS